MRFGQPLLSALLLVVPSLSWLQTRTSLLKHHHHQTTVHHPASKKTFSSLSSSASDDANSGTPDYTGKTIYQRTFYRLFGDSSLPNPNALVLEERLRFKSDPDRDGYILPVGKRTFIFRKGTSEDEITDELYRVDLGPNDGPGTMDTTIATVLYLASNPDIVQGETLQVACESGAAGILGCIAAKFARDPTPHPTKIQPGDKGADDEEQILTLPHHEHVFPPRLKHLTLSEEDSDNLSLAGDIFREFTHGDHKISLADVPWSRRIPSRRYKYYRTILGSDIDISFPSAKELARVVANSLLPSNPSVLATLESTPSSSGSGGPSFGGIGMDLADTSSSNGSSEEGKSAQPETDPRFPPTFVHVCPENRENTMYLRQFLEKGYKMNVNSDYVNLQRLQFVFQTLSEEDGASNEDAIEDLDLEVKSDTTRSYQCLAAVHNPEYVAEGSGEYFFPLESGEYEGGSRSTYLEPEEGGSPW